MKAVSILSVIGIVGLVQNYAQAAVPTAIFHGFGDTCIFPGMWEFTDTIANLTGAYAHCVEIGYGSVTSILENFETQAESACKSVQENPNFQGEFNVLGLSQGGLIARHIAERCVVKGKVRNLVTVGGPNMGVSATPNCFEGYFCNILNFIVKNLVYFSQIQDLVGPAGYFRDPNHLEEYLDYSVFLPFVNGEKKGNNTEAVFEKFSTLNSALFIMFSEDTMIYPKETAWFWQLQADGTVLPVNQTSFYKNDLIGLRALDEAGKTQYVEFEGNHLQFTNEQIRDVIAPVLLK
ncbi:palmitoyl-protein thioesterase 1-like [Stylonychia lemnae]|uniref:Palmitoyl-protein thioesterase 1-like n=1 Tax=Stylonychia lemnae TaxID=5949 RepID=A0A078AQA8_STYLE|nr:palmitoyl-protein thioesterase 1-like [Stylonychia lemnae]|eukprot:CDW83133.1 palmitoyl-protein thioesterase 1-like [Stylonychia lemnae]